MKTETVEKIDAIEVEVMNSSAQPEKITKVRVSDDEGSSSSNGTPSVEEFLKQMQENAGNGAAGMGEENPMMKMMGNVAEIKKIKIYFLISLLTGFWALFGWRDIMGGLAIVFGLLDLAMGSKLTEKASYVGILFGIVGLLLFFDKI